MKSFEDYRCDREGRLLGLTFAGQHARLVPVSIDHFLAWSASTGEPATVARLDEFAELVESFRRNPHSLFEACLSHESSGAKRTADGGFFVPVDPRSYQEWLECIRNNPSDALLDVYAGLLLELWTDKPRTPTFADKSLQG